MILLIEIMCRDQPAYRHRRKYFALLTCADSSQFLVNSLELTVDSTRHSNVSRLRYREP